MRWGTKVRCLWLVVILLLPSVAAAWEADGFRSGDSVERVEKEMASWGVIKRPRIPRSGLKGVYSIGAMGRWFTFCKDQLYEYDRPFDVTLSGFSTMLESEIKRLGEPSVGSGPVSASERGIWFNWYPPNEVFQLILGQEENRKLEATKRYTDVKLKRLCVEE